jgi:hypothetical protein
MPQIKVVVEVQQIRDGKVIKSEKTQNITCNGGIGAAASLLCGLTFAPFNYVAIGTGTLAPSQTDVALGSEVSRSVASSVTQIQTLVPNDTIQLTVGFSLVSPAVISEAGLFNASTAGILLGHVLIGPYNILIGDELTVTWNEVMAG